MSGYLLGEAVSLLSKFSQIQFILLEDADSWMLVPYIGWWSLVQPETVPADAPLQFALLDD